MGVRRHKVVWRSQVLPYFIDLWYRQFSVVAAIVEFYNEHVSKLQKLHNASSHSHCYGMFVETINMRMICFLTAAALMASSPLLCALFHLFTIFSHTFLFLLLMCFSMCECVCAALKGFVCTKVPRTRMDTVFFALFSSSSPSSSFFFFILVI